MRAEADAHRAAAGADPCRHCPTIVRIEYDSAQDILVQQGICTARDIAGGTMGV